jgi:putative ABC transport system substrate-binding protein
MEQTNSYNLALRAVLVAIWMAFMGSEPASAQTRLARVAILTPGLTFTQVHEGLQEGLARLGYKNNININYTVEDTKGRTSDLASSVAKLLTAKPDVLFTVTIVHTAAAKQATATVPISFAWVTDPVEAGIVASYASSKNNLTGVTSFDASLSGKRLEIFLELAPKIKRLLVLVVPRQSAGLISLPFLEETAKRLGIQLVHRDVATRDEIERALREIPQRSVDAVYFLPAAVIRANFDLLVKYAKKERIPLAVQEDALVEAGALFSYGPNSRLVGVQAAALVDKLLKGTKPSEIQVETPDRLFLTINLTTAKEIGLRMPRSILERADRVVD